MIRSRLAAALLVLVLGSSVARADWIDDYNAGLKAAQQENWQVVVQKMSAAIAVKPAENRQERTYGVNFVKYHPYYYRGVAYLNLGETQKALDDLKKAKGIGEVQLGAIDMLRDRAETRLAQAQTPATQTTTVVATTTRQPEPAPPVVDPVVRSAAEQMVAAARTRRTEATNARAGSLAAADFNRANTKLTDALNRQTTANSTADWRAVEKAADDAKRHFDLAINNAETALAQQQAAPERATEAVVAQTRRNVREALAAYFDGNFTDAERRLSRLVTNEQKNNAMLWAFLGAARYYSWYLNGAGNAKTRQDAETAFKRAKALRPQLQLEADYFSPRVRRFYRDLQG